MNATEFLKALSDPTRLSLVISLRDRQGLKEKSMCVCDLTALLAQPQPTVSRHLNHLKRVGILHSERKGTWMWYTLNPDIPDWCQQIIQLIKIDAELEQKLTSNQKNMKDGCCMAISSETSTETMNEATADHTNNQHHEQKQKSCC